MPIEPWEAVVGIDPGLRHCGVAVFNKSTLIRAGLVKNSKATERGPGCWTSMANAVAEWLGFGGQQIGVLVIEIPQIYLGPYAKRVNPTDIIELAGVDGAVAHAVPAARFMGYRPREWKSNHKKDEFAKRITAKLEPAEEAAIEHCAPFLRHNQIDAIGIGMFYLGRISK